jgi:hypothetical protein
MKNMKRMKEMGFLHVLHALHGELSFHRGMSVNYSAARARLAAVAGKRGDRWSPHLASRNAAAVARHPNPYFTLRLKLMDDASSA